MRIEKKRVRSLKNNLSQETQDKVLRFGIKVEDDGVEQQLAGIGFTPDLVEGESVLPSAIGRVSKYNAEGDFIKHTDKPMETTYRQAEWTWEQFSGYLQTETQSKIVDIPYQRYPRTFIEPPSEELEIKINPQGLKYVVSREVTYLSENEEEIVHIINLMLELFGYCEVLQKDLVSFIPTEVKKLNWEILPPGDMPWTKLKARLKRVIQNEPGANQKVLEKRHEAIASFEPEYVVVGNGGFAGYVVFAFPDRDLFVLESSQVNNATYITEEDWPYLSKLSKVEILANNLHKHRVIHRENWFHEIGKILENNV